MLIKQKLTQVAVDAIVEYLREKLEWLKQFDLDKDGRKDVDQIVDILMRCGQLTKEALENTNFSQIAAGLEQIMSGMNLIKSSLDQEKLTLMTRELGEAWKTIGHLAQLSVEYAKENPPDKPQR